MLDVNASDNCNNCHADHEFTVGDGNYRIYIFLESPICNHIFSTCPHCGKSTRIYCDPGVLVYNLSRGLAVSIGLEAPEELIAVRKALDDHDKIIEAFQRQLGTLEPRDFNREDDND